MFKYFSIILIVLGLTALPNIASSADNYLKQIRCHMHYDGSRPVRLRLALDFQQNPEKLILKKSREPYNNSLKGFIEDYIVVKQNGSSLDIVGNVNCKYGNAKEFVNIRVISNKVHLSLSEKYEMRGNSFNYVPATKVSYVDIDIFRRINIPTKSDVKTSTNKPAKQNKPIVRNASPTVIDSSITDTVFIEKVVHDTIIKVVHDTVFVDKITYLSRDDNKLTDIRCEHLVNWWNDPHYRIDFKFSETPVELNINVYNNELSNLPAGYKVQYKIVPTDATSNLFIQNIDIEYINCNNNILLIHSNEEYYLLAREGMEFQPHEFAYDNTKNLSYIRIRY